MSAGWETEDFLSSVAGEQKSDDQAHNAVNRVRVPIKEVHRWTRLLMRFCAVKNFGAKRPGQSVESRSLQNETNETYGTYMS